MGPLLKGGNTHHQYQDLLQQQSQTTARLYPLDHLNPQNEIISNNKLFNTETEMKNLQNYGKHAF